MGKKDGAQRTKGNTKPSSSARSAELLLQVHSDFGGDLSSNLAPIFGLTSLSPEEEAQIPSEMKMAIRKMSKKDPITRLKALQEFADVCQGVEGSNDSTPYDEEIKVCIDDATKAAVKAMLPFWPRLYQRLSQDVDRRVREACQRSHYVIISIVNRDIAPFLKSLAPFWYLSRSDPHLQAALLAEKSFSLAFTTEEKRRSAVIFCHAEILGQIQDNLLSQTAETLFDAKMADPEDKDSKYFRVLSTSLLSYSHFIRDIATLGGNFLDEECSQLMSKQKSYHKKILSSAQFWKFSNHKNIGVRSAWFTLAGTLSEVVICISGQEDIFDTKLIEKLSLALLTNLDETDAILMPIIWEASLHLLKNCKSWPKTINFEKQVVPKFRSNIESDSNRCQIAPYHIYPNVLPFVSLLLPRLREVWTDEEKDSKTEIFFADILKSIEKGFKFFSSLNSVSGRMSSRKGGPSHSAKMAIEAYFECLTYAVTCHDRSQNTIELVQNTISRWLHHIPSVRDGESLEMVLLFSSLSKFVQRLSSKVEAQSDKLLNTFYFEMLNNICQTVHKLYEEEEAQSLNLCAQLLLEFMRSQDGETRQKKGKLSFDEPNTESIYLTPCFMRIEEHSPNDQELSSIPAELRTVLFTVIESSFGKVIATDKVSVGSCHLDFVSRLLGKYLSAGNADLFFKSDTKDLSGPVEMLNALMRSKVIDQAETDKEIDANLTNLCIAIARSIELQTKLALYDGLFTQPKDRRLADRLLVSLLQAEVDKTPEKESILSSAGFSTRIQQISDDMVLEKKDIDKESLRLAAIAFQNHNLIPGNHLDNLLLQMSKYLKKGQRKLSILNFVCDLFTWMGFRPSETFDFVSNPGCINLLMRILKILFDEASPFTSVVTRILGSAVDVLKRSEKALERYLIEACHLIRANLEQKVFSQRILTQAIDLLKLVEASQVGTWQNYFLKMLPELKNLYPARNSVDVVFAGYPLGMLKTKNATLDIKDERNLNIVEFYLKVSGNFEDDNDNEMTEELMNHYVWVIAVLGSRGFNDSPGLEEKRNMSNTYLKSLSITTIQKLVSKIFSQSVENGWESASALDNLLDICNCVNGINLQIETLFSNLMNVQQLTEGQTQTLQVLLKFTSLDNLNNLLESLVMSITSFDPGEKVNYSDLAAKTFVLGSCIDQIRRKVGLDEHLDLEEKVSTVLALLTQMGSETPEKFLFATSLKGSSFENTSLALAKCNLMTSLVKMSLQETRFPLSSDAILCDLSCWCETLEESIPIIQSIFTNNPPDNCLEVAITTTSILSLLQEVIRRFVHSDHARLKEIDEYKQRLLEWDDLFADNYYRVIINIFLGIVNSSYDCKPTPINQFARDAVISSVRGCLTCVPSKGLTEFPFPPKIIADDLVLREATFFTDNVTYQLNHLVPLLSWNKGSTCENFCVREASCFFLIQVMSQVVRCIENGMERDNSKEMVHLSKPPKLSDTNRCEENPTEEDEDLDEICELPTRITEILERSETVLKKIFTDSELLFGEPIPVMFPVDSHAYDCVHAMILAWRLILEITDLTSIELRPKISEFLRRKGHVSTLIETIFHLVTLETVENRNNMFTIDLKEQATTLYRSLLKDLPAWNSADKRSSSIVEKLTIDQFSPEIWSEEALGISKDGVHENLTIKVRQGVREVVAIYSLEEDNLELVITVPKNFPLGALQVESRRKIGVTNGQWRMWMLQLTIFLQHQNGSIVDGLLVWKNNLDKRFDGVEECYICYFILHGASHQLPKVACRQCKKKFHSACLYKWFSTSGSSSCPLCRTLF